MYCYSCGMQSRTNDRCEWCKKPMQGGPGQTAQPLDLTQPVQPVMTQTRTSLTGEVVETVVHAPANPPGVYAPPPPVGVVAAPGRPPSVMSPAAAAANGLPHQAVTGRMMQQAAAPRVSLGEKWEKCLALLLPMMVGSAWLIHKVPGSFIWVTLLDLFLAGLFMGASGAIGSYDDAYLDCTVVLLVCYFFGPVIGLAVYLIVGAIKQELNGAMVFLLIGHVLIRFIDNTAIATIGNSLGGIIAIGFANFLGFFFICASFAGWMMSSFFRPLNE